MPKWLFIGTVVLFSLIGGVAFIKKGKGVKALPQQSLQQLPIQSTDVPKETSVISMPLLIDAKSSEGGVSLSTTLKIPVSEKSDFPSIDRMHQLFGFGSSKLPIVETVTYASTVPWLKGRPAWIADYASYYMTSRHFIARSLNGKADYFTQKIREGSRFNVFCREKHVQFYLLVDVSLCKMGLYYLDLDTNERVLLKTYRVGLGRMDLSRPSGTLTPLGRYSLGDRVAIYKPGIFGSYLDKKVEMMSVFGTRWIPFEREVERTSCSAKGYGIQGVPWIYDSANGKWIECRDRIGVYDSDGCIRLLSEDLEELFAVVITKPTFVEIVKDFREAKLPGVEVAAPSR